MDMATIVTLIGLAGVLSGLILGWMARSRDSKKIVKEDVQQLTKMQSSLEHVKQGIDDIKAVQRAHDYKLDNLNAQLVLTNAATEKAHLRVDHLHEILKIREDRME